MKVQSFVNLMFQFGLVPTTNKFTRVKNIATFDINQIITNSTLIMTLRLE